MWKALFAKLKEALTSVLPVGIIVFILSFTPLIDLTGREMTVFGISALLLIAGIALFNLGADLAMTPMGQFIGEGLTKSRKKSILLIVSFVMGLLITIAEPDLSVLAEQVSSMMNGTLLIVTVGLGVGIFLLMAVLKIVHRIDLTSMLLFFYLMLFSLAALLFTSDKGDMLPMSFDSGGVTTGPITVPFIMALGVGIALTVGGRRANENSFGLIALCSIGPIIAVMLLSLFSKGTMSYDIPDYSMESVLAHGVGTELLETMLEVGKSLLLIILFFLLLQLFILKLPRHQLISIAIGICLTFAGLAIFLTAVAVGFMPVGYKIGTQLAAFNPNLMVLICFIIGGVVVLAEPAVHAGGRHHERPGHPAPDDDRPVNRRRPVDRPFDPAHHLRILAAVLSDPRLPDFPGTLLLRTQTLYGHRLRLRRRGQRSVDLELHPADGDRRLHGAAFFVGSPLAGLRRGGHGGHDPADHHPGPRIQGRGDRPQT